MNDIRSILKVARRRLEMGDFLACAHVVLVVLGAVVLLMLVAERVGEATFWPWAWVGPVLAGLGGLVVLRLWARRRRTELQIAVEVDDRLDLREKLSTAMHVADRVDPFARAAVDDAVATARDPRVREKVGRSFAVRSPRRWWLSPLVIALAVGAWLMPPLHLFAAAGQDDQQALADTVKQRDEAVDAVVKTIKENPQLRNQMSDVLGELARQRAEKDPLKTREEVQRDAIKRLTDLNKKLDDILNGEQGKTADAVDRTLKQLKPTEGPARELAEALARGDFKAAQEALAKLQQDARDGKLTQEQKQQLAAQLNDLANQLQQLAAQQQALQAALQQAGLNPQLAQNPKALQQAIQNNPNLNDQQKQQLQQMAQAQQMAQQMCQGMSQGMGQMAQGLMAGQMQAGAGQLGQQLNQLEAMKMMLQQAQAAAGACAGQCQGLGQGLGMQAAMQQWMQQSGAGGAFGQRGHGAGGKAPIAPTPTGTKLVKSPTKTTGGDIIARQFVDGPVVVGESEAKFHDVAAAINEGFDEAQSDEQIPPKYRDAHMHYFGELEKRVEAVKREPAKSDQPKESTGDGGGS